MLAGLVVGLLAAIATHLCSAQAVQSVPTADGVTWHLQAAVDTVGAVVGFALGGAAAHGTG